MLLSPIAYANASRIEGSSDAAVRKEKIGWARIVLEDLIGKLPTSASNAGES